jgi:hypothetical protein
VSGARDDQHHKLSSYYRRQLAALVFERLEQRHSLSEIVISLRIPPEDVRDLYHAWLVGLWLGELQRPEPALPPMHDDRDVVRRVTLEKPSTRLGVHDPRERLRRVRGELGGFTVTGPMALADLVATTIAAAITHGRRSTPRSPIRTSNDAPRGIEAADRAMHAYEGFLRHIFAVRADHGSAHRHHDLLVHEHERAERPRISPIPRVHGGQIVSECRDNCRRRRDVARTSQKRTTEADREIVQTVSEELGPLWSRRRRHARAGPRVRYPTWHVPGTVPRCALGATRISDG